MFAAQPSGCAASCARRAATARSSTGTGSRSRSARFARPRTQTARRRCSATATSTFSRPTRSSSGTRPRSSRRFASDYLYGRGTVDDKGQLYMLLAAARELAKARRAAGERSLLLRRRRGDRRPFDRRVPRAGLARRRRGDHLRQRHDSARRTGVQPRDARHGVLPPHACARATAICTPACTAARR